MAGPARLFRGGRCWRGEWIGTRGGVWDEEEEEYTELPLDPSCMLPCPDLNLTLPPRGTEFIQPPQPTPLGQD